MALSVLMGSESMVAKKVVTYEGPGFSFFIMTSGLRTLRDKALLYFEEAYTRQIAARDRLFKVVNLDAGQVRRLAEEKGPPLPSSLVGGQMSSDSEH
jgi:putative proteasome-type protease